MKYDRLQYLKTDLNILYQVVGRFRDIMYDKFSIDITKSPTISALSFRVYIKNFYKTKYNVKFINKQVDHDIRQGHYGGIVKV